MLTSRASVDARRPQKVRGCRSSLPWGTAVAGLAFYASYPMLLLAGCGGTSLAISAKPDRWVCPGTPITLSWQASRAPTITPTPAVQGLDDLPHFGSHPVPIAQKTHFVISGGHWWWSNQLPLDVTAYDPSFAQFPTGSSPPLKIGKAGSEIQCSGDTAWEAFNQEGDHWDPRLIVGSVKSLGSEKISVWHAGIRADVDSTPSTAFKDMPMQGIWLLETSCHPRPHTLGIAMTATCNPKAPCGGQKP